jgi:hypothetical protein
MAMTQQTLIAYRWSSTAVEVLGLEIHQRSIDEWPQIAGTRVAALKAAAIADRLNEQGSRTPQDRPLDGSGDLVGDENISTAGGGASIKRCDLASRHPSRRRRADSAVRRRSTVESRRNASMRCLI